MATTLRIEHLVKRFEGLVAVNDLSIDVQERKIHALIGPNGSGKTTTLNLINSVIPPTSGQIWFRDTLLTGKPTFETVKAGIGRTFQNIKLFSSMTVLENVMMGGQKDVSRNTLRFIVSDLARQLHREERVLREKACEVLDDIHRKAQSICGNADRRAYPGLWPPEGLRAWPRADDDAAAHPARHEARRRGLNPSERREFADILRKRSMTAASICSSSSTTWTSS